MKVAVTGAGGMIGHHLVARLVDEGHEVVAVDIKHLDDWWQAVDGSRLVPNADMGDINVARWALAGCDETLDLACPMGGIGWISRELYSCFSSLKIQLATVEACIAEGVGRYFYASSACAYNTDLQSDPDVPIRLKESDAFPSLPERGYGEAKLAAERLAEYARIDRGLETRVARFHNVAGAPGSWNDGKEKAPAAICRKVAEAKLSGHHEIEVWGDGTQVRSYLDVSDCVDGILAVMRGDHPDPMNVGSDRGITVNELVDLAEQAAGIKVKRRYDRSKPRGVASRNADLMMVESMTGWRPKVSTEEMIAKVYAWIEDQLRA